MRTILLTLALLAAVAAWAGQAPAQNHSPVERAIERAFGVTLGESMPLSSKQVHLVGRPGKGLERYRLLRTPASRPPFARHWATVDVHTGRVAAMTAQTRPLGSTEKTWKIFREQIEVLESEYGTGMRVGGGAMWKLVRSGRSIALTLEPEQRQVTLRLADDKRMGLGSHLK